MNLQNHMEMFNTKHELTSRESTAAYMISIQPLNVA